MTPRREYLPVFVFGPQQRPTTRKQLPIFAEERRLIKRAMGRVRELELDRGALRT